MPPRTQRTAFPEYLRPSGPNPRGGRSLRWALFLGAGSLLVYLLLLSDSGLLTLHRHRAEVDHLHADLAELAREQAYLQGQIDELETPGSFMLERVARERYGMVRDGERVIHVVEPDAPATSGEVP